MPSKSTPSAISVFSPEASIFVSANAGSGKTSLLTKRVLGLLLNGIEPSRILCLTFTNAAATEMSNRVLRQLGEWVMMSEENLTKALEELLSHKPDKHLLAFARSLFARVLDAPDGIRIQTIHGFCQSLLRRFPLEAGVSPHFSVMDNRTAEALLYEAKIRLFNHVALGDAVLSHAMNSLLRVTSEKSLQDILTEIIKNKQKFLSILNQQASLPNTQYDIHRLLNVAENLTEQTLVDEYFSYDDLTLHKLRKAVSAMLQGSVTDQTRGEKIAKWLAYKERTPERADEYRQAFLTDKQQYLKSIFTKNCFSEEVLAEAMLAEFEHVKAFDEKLRNLRTAQRSSHMLTLAHALLEQYTTLKLSHAQMDYDDLILTTHTLLNQKDITPWVLYKLDGGIDHLLVDEAQDTSPLQWHIIKALTQEFFAGEGRSTQLRSLFIVGDEKQSIYRFQGADVLALKTMQDYFIKHIQESGNIAKREILQTSYRSLPNILKAVDSVFAQPTARNGLMFDEVALHHIAHRKTPAGYVEIWPLLHKDDEYRTSAKNQLIRKIADTIAHWLSDGMSLESKGRAIHAGDIMVLVRTRTDFVDKLSRALKRRNIPVEGIDRMKLSDNLAVQDLIALGQFLLLPEDDLTLACVLKSPIVNSTEEELFQLAYGREDQSLWARLSQYREQNKTFDNAYALLKDLRSRVDFITPYELYSYLLDTCGIRRKFTGRMGKEYNEAIDEFLSQALVFEQSHIPTLQGFLHWLASSESELKRDMEASKGAVRIMTIHAAKGLQAPIVILPDTCSKPEAKDRILWNSTPMLPLWPENVHAADVYCRHLREQEKLAIEAEYRRQLYVAMTRAEDMMFVAGYTEKGSQASEGSWYDLIAQGLADIADSYEMHDAQALRLGKPPTFGQYAMNITLDQSAVFRENETLHYLHTPVQSAPEPSKPLAPSKLPDDAPYMASPLDKQKIFNRGECIHLLLQHLPQAAEDKKPAIIAHVMTKYRQTMTEEELQSCIHEAQTIITHPDFLFIFGNNSMAEVPVTGVVHILGRPYTVSGQIDRLYIGDTIWIIDYKTGQVPYDLAIPTHYLRQMTLYKLLLSEIYPHKPIQCALLWTSTPQITLIPEALLDESAFSSYI